MQSHSHLRGVSCVITASALWGTTGVSATFAPAVSSAAIGAAAMGVGGLLQALVALRPIAKNQILLQAQWRLLLLGAVAVAIYPIAFYGSMRTSGVTIGTVVSLGSAPLMAALLELMLDRARLGARWISGATLGVAGMAILSVAAHSNAASVASHTTHDMAAGIGMGLVAGFTYALYSWAARRLMQHRIPSRAAMGSMFGLGGLFLMPVLCATGAPFLQSWTNASVGLYMALIPMFVGYLFFGYGLARVSASTATTITLLEPVVAAALAAAIVGERLTPWAWAGIGLIFLSLAWITWPTKPRLSAVAASASQ